MKNYNDILKYHLNLYSHIYMYILSTMIYTVKIVSFSNNVKDRARNRHMASLCTPVPHTPKKSNILSEQKQKYLFPYLLLFLHPYSNICVRIYIHISTKPYGGQHISYEAPIFNSTYRARDTFYFLSTTKIK